MSVARGIAFLTATVVLPLIVGTLCGPRIPNRDERSGRLVLISLVTGYPVVTFLAGWRVTIDVELIWLPIMGMVTSLVGLGLGYMLSCIHRWENGMLSRGAYIFAVGLNNMGHTGGTLICFALLGEEAFAQGALIVMHWQFLIYLVCFPLAKRWSESQGPLPLRQEIVAALRDPRLLPLVGLILGLVVKACGVPRPAILFPVNAVLIALTAATASFAVGITIRPEKFKAYGPLYVSQFVGKFVLLPAIMWAAGQAVGLSPLAVKAVLIQASCPQAFYSVFLVHLFQLSSDQLKIVQVLLDFVLIF